MKNTLIALLTIVLLAVSSVAFAAEFSLGDIGAVSLLDVTTLISCAAVSVTVTVTVKEAEVKEVNIVLGNAKNKKGGADQEKKTPPENSTKKPAKKLAKKKSAKKPAKKKSAKQALAESRAILEKAMNEIGNDFTFKNIAKKIGQLKLLELLGLLELPTLGKTPLSFIIIVTRV